MRWKTALFRRPLELARTAGAQNVRLFAAVLVCAGLVLAFGLVARQVMEGDTHEIDLALLMAFRSGNPPDLLGPEWFEEMVRDVTALGSYAFIILILAIALGYLLIVRKLALATVVMAAVLGGILLSNILKYGFGRPRPDIEHAAQIFTPSFPSGHATLSAVTFLTLGALLMRVSDKWSVKAYFLAIAILLTLLVGISRIYLGVHYPSDVLAGWCVGAAWALLCWAGAYWLQQRGTVEKPDRTAG